MDIQHLFATSQSTKRELEKNIRRSRWANKAPETLDVSSILLMWSIITFVAVDELRLYAAIGLAVSVPYYVFRYWRHVAGRRVSKKLEQYCDSGHIVRVNEEILDLWANQREIAGVPNDRRANLDQPRYYDLVRKIGRAQSLIAEEQRLHDDNADVGRFVQKLQEDMDESLKPLVQQIMDERAALKAAQHFEEGANSKAREITTLSDKELHDKASQRFLDGGS